MPETTKKFNHQWVWWRQYNPAVGAHTFTARHLEDGPGRTACGVEVGPKDTMRGEHEVRWDGCTCPECGRIAEAVDVVGRGPFQEVRFDVNLISDIVDELSRMRMETRSH